MEHPDGLKVSLRDDDNRPFTLYHNTHSEIADGFKGYVNSSIIAVAPGQPFCIRIDVDERFDFYGRGTGEPGILIAIAVGYEEQPAGSREDVQFIYSTMKGKRSARPFHALAEQDLRSD